MSEGTGLDREAGGGTGDMATAEFRAAGHRLIDWVATYLETVGELPVLPDVKPGDVLDILPAEAPEQGEPFERILDDLDRVILPATTHWNHPSFFGYFAITGSGPGILGELAAAAFNVNAMVWRSGPAATELEYRTLAWLRDLMGLPAGFTGTINDTASTSTFHAVVAARERAYPEARDQGLAAGPPGRVYTSTEAHSSVAKAVAAMGLGREGVCAVATGPGRGMDPEALRERMARDAEAGVRPVAVVATVGTTSTAAVDPVDVVAEVAREHGAWLHVDAAYAGPAAMLASERHAFAGWDAADSIVVNPHKWLFTPIDCSILYVRDPEALRAAFSLTPAYLETPEEGRVTHLMDQGLALGRRFRSLKLWFVMRHFGAEGLRRRIRGHIELARAFADRLDESADWERWTPTNFSLVVFRHRGNGEQRDEVNGVNRAILDRVNASGAAFLSHTELDGDVWLRLAVGNIRTTEADLEGVWDALRAAAAAGYVAVD